LRESLMFVRFASGQPLTRPPGTTELPLPALRAAPMPSDSAALVVRVLVLARLPLALGAAESRVHAGQPHYPRRTETSSLRSLPPLIVCSSTVPMPCT